MWWICVLTIFIYLLCWILLYDWGNHDQSEPGLPFFVFILSPLAILVFFFYYAENVRYEECMKWEYEIEIIQNVGGCNKYGVCGVITDKGNKYTMMSPVVGEAITQEKYCSINCK